MQVRLLVQIDIERNIVRCFNLNMLVRWFWNTVIGNCSFHCYRASITGDGWVEASA